MKTSRFFILPLLLAWVPLLRAADAGTKASVPAGKPQQLTSPDQVPEGLAKSDWSSIRAAYEAGRHTFQPIKGGWQACNPGQQWTTSFDRRGFIAEPKGGGWQWGLELKSYGFGTTQQAVGGTPSVKAEGQRLSYQWNGSVQEWFVNDKRGLEHGFTIEKRPAQNSSLNSQSSTLDFLLATRGTLHPSISADAQSVLFRDDAGATVINYTGLKVWDADGKILHSLFEAAGETDIRLRVEECGARYPLTIDPIAQQAYLKSGNNADNNVDTSSDNFGYSVSVSGDTVVVGAPYEDSNTAGVNSTPNEGSTDSGAAYLFVRSGTTWSQQAYLKASNTGANDNFGISVSVSGDTVVVGAPYEDSSTTGVNSTPNESSGGSGAAYVFTRSGTIWSQQAYLKAGNTGANDQFGTSVAVSGDTVVVGAIGEASSTTGVNSTPNESAFGSGAAYVFIRSGTAWNQQVYLKASNTGASDTFGWSVAVSVDTVVVGAYNEDSGTTGVNSTPNEISSASGAAYVFTRSGTTWSQQAYLKASNTGANDVFGLSVSVSGDTVVVGAYQEDSSTIGVNSTANESASNSGAAYVFTRSGTVWTQQAYLKAGNTGAFDNFGYSVSVSGDTVVVGARFEASNTTGVNSTPNESASNSGAAYVFTRSGTAWSQQAYLKASNTEASDFFGYSVAVSGDTVVVGTLYEDSSTKGVNSTPNESAPDSGAAYIFTRGGTAWSQQAYLKAGGNSGAEDRFGTSVSVSGDTVVVGAYLEDSGTFGVNSTPNESATDSGAAYVFVRSGSVWTQQAYLKASNTGPNDHFGASVGVSGDTIVVGATDEDSSTTGVNSTPNESATNSGAAYVFTRSGTTWSQQAYIKAANTGATDSFGYAAGVSGDTVVVGAYTEDGSSNGVNGASNESAPDSGAAYVFVRSGTTWSQQAYLKAGNTGTGDVFGWSVGVSADTVIVGSYQEDSSTSGVNSAANELALSAGAAYVYTRSGTTWSQQAYLKASNPGNYDLFGFAVAVSGNTVIVGALNEASSTNGVNSTPNESAGQSGAAYVFTRSGTTWSQQAYLKASNTGAIDQFGYSVAISGDTVTVGAPTEDSGTAGVNSTPNESVGDSGAAYVFVRNGAVWNQQAYLKANNPGVSDQFGLSVAVAGDTVVLGALGEDSGTSGVNSTPNEGTTDAGATYIFTGLGPAPTVSEIFPASGSASGGTNVTITGTGFTGASAVTFGGTPATSFTVNSATSISATTPAHAASAVNVAVTTSTGTATGPNLFTYLPQAANTFAHTGSLSTARALHTATLLPNGKLLVAGGQNDSNILASAELYDPATGTWTATGSLAAGRQRHTATLLPNGKVLVAGGYNNTYLASAELYDPATGTWTATGSLVTPRGYHTSTLLPNGKVLVAGGVGGAFTSAELYDPATGTWTATGSLATARYFHTATLLPNGKVLVAGGGDNGGNVLASAELYDPVTGTWTATGSLAGARYAHITTLLPNGKVLVAGGDGNSGRLASAELYDPANGTWTATGSLATARYNHTATLLPNDKLLVAGGSGSDHLASAELYDPATGTWTATGSLATARYFHTATLLPNGKLLVAGGFGNSGYRSSAELYDSAAGIWTTTNPLTTGRYKQTATLLPNGKVLVGGGNNGNALASAELYDPVTGNWAATGTLVTARAYHMAILLPNGKVLAAGGYNGSNSLASTEIYDPPTGAWSTTGSLTTARLDHSATLLPNGKVLVAGGDSGSGYRINSAEIYDPATGTCSTTAPLATARRLHTATLLPSGKVLVAGGYGDGGSLSTAELYDPATGSWAATGSLVTARYLHTATLLPNGKVLVAAGPGGGSYLASAELYDPATGTWGTTGSLATGRMQHTATLLPSGKVIVAGGAGSSGNLSSAELYDPATGTWAATGTLASPRGYPTATLLPAGKLLVAGGYNGNALASAELYDVGLGFSGASRPVIGTASLNASGKLSLTGTGFLGLSSASGGNGSQDSPTNYPVLQLRRLDNEQCAFLSYDPSVNVSASSLRSLPVSSFSGYAFATVFTNGIPSNSALVLCVPDIALEAPTGTAVTNGSGTLAYGSIALGQTKDPSITVRNTGSIDLSTIAASLTGLDAGQFSLVSTPPATLSAGASAAFTVRFSPTSSGPKTATLSIASNDPDENPFILALTGTAILPPIDYVTVGNAGNAADGTGYGAVSYVYKIAKYETTISQYCNFLNAVAKSDPFGLYNTNMASYGINRSGNDGSYAYSVTGGFESKPMTYVSWFDAARFCNWLHNGQGGGNTEIGAYTLSGAMSGIITANPNAMIHIPTENEWYKAAYYNGAAATYWLYPTKSNSITGGDANYYDTDSGIYIGAITNVGSYSADPGYYGTFDQAGNVWEWNDAIISGSMRLMRGGSWNNLGDGVLRSSNRSDITPTTEHLTIGFRVARPLTAPEAWRYFSFGQADSTGTAADSADPDHDGLVNLLERAFNLNPNQPALPILTEGTGTTGLPLIRRTGQPPVFSIQYLRRKASANSGLNYTPQFSTSLTDSGPAGWATATGTETVQSIDSEWERVTVEEDAGGQQKRFGRVKVSAQ